MFNISWTSMLGTALRMRSACLNVRALLHAWLPVARQQKVTQALNRKLRASKKAQAEELIADAKAADSKELTHVYQVMHCTQPKLPKRAVHRKTAARPQESLKERTAYFSKLYQTPQCQSMSAQWAV